MDMIIGILFVAALWVVVEYARKSQIVLKGWHWLLTILGIAYAAFVLKVIVDFIAEGAPMAGLVMGIVLGLVAVIWGALLARFVFKPTR